MTPQQLLTQIKSGTLAPIYLFLGPEMYRRRVCRRLLLEKFLPPEMREEGFTRHDLDETPLRDVIDDASAYSLFASKRVLYVTSAEAALPRSPSSEIESNLHALVAGYVANPTPDTVLIFDSSRLTFESEDKSKLDRLRKIFSTITTQVEFQPYSDDDARKLAADLAQKAKLQISPSALEMLVDALGSDAARLANEIEKLSLYTNGQRPVTEEDIAALAPDARSTTIFALVNSLSRGDRTTSLDLLETLVREGEYLPLALAFLATQFRFALAAREEGLRTAQQIQGHFSKLGVAMWPSRAQQVVTTMSAFSKPKLEQAILKIYETDKALRDRAPDDRIVLDDLVLTLTSKS